MKVSKKHTWILPTFLSMILCSCSYLNSYQEEGTLVLPGLREPVTVVRDEKGMAYIYACNLEDAIMAQGFFTAQGRRRTTGNSRETR